MADIQFEEPEYARPLATSGPQGIIGLVRRWGLAKDDRQASYVLLGFVAIAIITAIMVGLSGPSQSVQDGSRAMIEKAIKATNAPQ